MQLFLQKQNTGDISTHVLFFWMRSGGEYLEGAAW